MSEEGEKLEGDIDTFWCVDPLDGTKEFIKKNGEFTVNIALIENHQPVLGVIHIPVANETFMALKGEGAFKIQNNQTQALIKQTGESHSPPSSLCLDHTSMKKRKTFINSIRRERYRPDPV